MGRLSKPGNGGMLEQEYLGQMYLVQEGQVRRASKAAVRAERPGLSVRSVS